MSAWVGLLMLARRGRTDDEESGRVKFAKATLRRVRGPKVRPFGVHPQNQGWAILGSNQ